MTFFLWLRFLGWPALLVGVLGVLELRFPSQTGFLMRASLVLAGYAVGSIVPLLHSDELLYLKFCTITVDGEKSVLTLSQEGKQKLQNMKDAIFLIFAIGLVTWIANAALADVIHSLPFPLLAKWLWVSGFAYALICGGFYVYLRFGRNSFALPKP